MNLEQYVRKVKAAEQRYMALRYVINERNDLAASAKKEVLKAAADEYAHEVEMTRTLLAEKVTAQAETLAEKRQSLVRKNLTALYEAAEKQGPAAAQVASRLVELNGPSELWSLYRSGDPLIRGLIALSPSRYADSQDPASVGLQKAVEKDMLADIAEAGRSLKHAQAWLSALSNDPEANLKRRKELYGGFASDVHTTEKVLIGEPDTAALQTARNELTRLLNLIWQ